MKQVISLAIAATLATSAVLVGQAQTKPAPKPTTPAVATGHAAVEKALAANETKLNEAYTKGDVATMKSMIADDATVVDMSGTMNAGDMFKMMPSVKISVSEQALTNMKFVWTDDNTVVLTYTWTGKGTVNGQPIPSPTYSSSVWTRRAGKWVAVFHQETTAAPAPVKK